MPQKLPAFFFFLFLVFGTHAQCVLWQNVPALILADTSNNNPELWNSTPFLDIHTGNVDLGETPVTLDMTLVDACSVQAALRYQLWLDLDGDGTTETLVDSDNPPIPGYVYMNGDTAQFDKRPQPFYAYFRFVLDTVWSGDTLHAQIFWAEDDNPGAPRFNVELPYGKHRIVWTYGGESFSQTLEVRDGLAPELECVPSITFTITVLSDQFIFYLVDFVAAFSDNHTPSDQLQLSMRRAGLGTGFPLSALGNPVSTLGFDCYELGLHPIEIWVRDHFGNTNFCTANLLIQTNGTHCDFFGYRQHIRTERLCDGGAVYPMTLHVYGDNLNPLHPLFPLLPPTIHTIKQADTLGSFVLPLEYNSYDFSVSFEDNNPNNADFSTADLIRTLRHVQGSQAFTDPFQFVAADANNDRQITDEDVDALHALLTGSVDTLPGQQRWQYLPDNFVFPPGDPLTDGIPDTLDIPENTAANLRFFAIQTGDVNCAEPSALGPAFPVTATDRALLAGETASVTVYAAEAETWLGLQTSVAFHPSVELLNVFGSAALPLQDNHVQEAPAKVLNISWFGAAAQSITDSAALFTLIFKTSLAIPLSEAIQLSDVRLVPEVYPQAGGKRPLVLLWDTAADAEAPVVDCPVQPINLVIMPGTFSGMLVVADSMFAATDNATPDSMLERAIRRVGTGAGFPLENNGEPNETVDFFCDDVFFNPHQVECWVRDAAGNAAFCIREVWVNDPNFVCDPPTLPFSACVTTACGNEPLDSVAYRLTEHGAGNPAVLDTVTSADGCYQSPLLQPGVVSDSVTLQARKNTVHLNGVSTFDMVLMLKHVLGLEPFSEPYQLLAADVNNSNNVTTFDVAELRKLLLGIYDSLPENDSWRLYPANYAFPSPNPLAGGVPNTYTFDLRPGGYQLACKAVKVGDVNCSASANGLQEPADREPFSLYFSDQTLNPGETIKLPVFARQAAQWDGFQLAMELQPGLTLETVSGGVYTTISEENWHLTEKNVLNLSWITGETATIPTGEPLFYLHLRAAQKMHMAEAVSLKKGALRAEAYPTAGRVQLLELHPHIGKQESALLAPPQPNPTSNGATMRVYLVDDETMTLQLFTIDGKSTYRQIFNRNKGAHDIIVPADAMLQPGFYLWRLQSGNAVWTGKIQKF